MNYKTIVLELLQDRPQLHDQLRQQRRLLATMEALAQGLKNRHEAWTEQLSQASPDSDPHQIASEALEIALKELMDSLPSDSSADESEALSLDAAMAYLHRHSWPVLSGFRKPLRVGAGKHRDDTSLCRGESGDERRSLGEVGRDPNRGSSVS